MISRLFKSNTLYVEVSNSYIKLCFINRNNSIKDYISISLIKDAIQNDKVINTGYFESILKDYISKSGYLFNKVILIINVEAILRFVSYPYVNQKDLKSTIHYSLKDYLLVDLSLYTTDYRIISYNEDNIEVLLVCVKTEIIESYIKVFENLKISINVIDLYQNFISTYLAKKDKGKYIIGVSQKDKILIQFIEKGKYNYIKDIDNTDITRIFSQHINLNGDIDIQRAYLSIDVDKDLIKFLDHKGVDIIYIKSLFNLWEDKELEVDELWDFKRGL